MAYPSSDPTIPLDGEYHLVPITSDEGMRVEGSAMNNCVKDEQKIRFRNDGTHEFYSMQDRYGNRVASVVFTKGPPRRLFDARILNNQAPNQHVAESIINYMNRNRIELGGVNLESQIGFYSIYRIQRPNGEIIFSDIDPQHNADPNIQGRVLSQSVVHESVLRNYPNYYVHDDLMLSTRPIRRLPEGFTVNGNLELRQTRLTELPERLTVTGLLDISGMPFSRLPQNFNINSLDISNTAVQLPDNLTLRGDLIATGWRGNLPRGLRVRNLTMTGTGITLDRLPPDIEVTGRFAYVNAGGEPTIIEGARLRETMNNYIKSLRADQRPSWWSENWFKDGRGPRSGPDAGTGGGGGNHRGGGNNNMSISAETIERGVIGVAEAAARFLAWPVNLGFFVMESGATAVTWYAMRSQVEDMLTRGAISQQEANTMYGLANTMGGLGMLDSIVGVLPGGKWLKGAREITQVLGVTTTLAQMSNEELFQQMVNNATARMEHKVQQGIRPAQARQEFNAGVDASIAHMRALREQATHKNLDFSGNPDPNFFVGTWSSYVGGDAYTYTSRNPRELLQMYGPDIAADPRHPDTPARSVLRGLLNEPAMRELLQRDPDAFLEQLNEALRRAQERVPHERERLIRYWDRAIENMERFRGDTLREFDRRIERGVSPISERESERPPVQVAAAYDPTYNQPAGSTVSAPPANVAAVTPPSPTPGTGRYNT